VTFWDGGLTLRPLCVIVRGLNSQDLEGFIRLLEGFIRLLEGFIRLLERVLEDTILNNSILLRML
jgi:hypothetical protein